ncbi:hypothetical protein JTE90_000640 [Oedothorax gibbosus]|uniref:Uncharacterized protein n=1 Tax=Oedothorax gibbosus TaxID=931172 RepID=A0AAV6VXU7_9ARAC|nr:hypothetical protein JTE90_000640 [Oedothorax gibbosus]
MALTKTLFESTGGTCLASSHVRRIPEMEYSSAILVFCSTREISQFRAVSMVTWIPEDGQPRALASSCSSRARRVQFH